jgi:hypothetical protein
MSLTRPNGIGAPIVPIAGLVTPFERRVFTAPGRLGAAECEAPRPRRGCPLKGIFFGEAHFVKAPKRLVVNGGAGDRHGLAVVVVVVEPVEDEVPFDLTVRPLVARHVNDVCRIAVCAGSCCIRPVLVFTLLKRGILSLSGERESGARIVHITPQGAGSVGRSDGLFAAPLPGAIGRACAHAWGCLGGSRTMGWSGRATMPALPRA